MQNIAFLDGNEKKVNSEYKVVTVSPSKNSIDEYSKGFKNNKGLYKPEWMQEWAEKKINNEKSIKDLLVYKDQTLWYFYEFLLYGYVKELPFHPTSTILYYIDVIEEIIKKEKPRKIIIQNKEETFYRLVIEIAKKKKIKVVSLNKKTRKSLQKRAVEERKTISFYLRLRILARYLLGRLMRRKEECKVLLLSNERFCRGPNERNVFWGTIAKELGKERVDYEVVEHDVLWNYSSLFKMLRRDFKKYPRMSSIGAYYDKKSLAEINEIVTLSRNVWLSIKDSDKLRNSMNYNGINIYEYLKPRFEVVFSELVYYIADCTALAGAVARKMAPELVAVEHEYSYYGMGFLNNSKRMKYKTIALQFESVNTRTSVHRHVRNKKVMEKKSRVWRPLADVKCASGKWAKKILIENCNFPEQSIAVTGQPRYDQLSGKKKYEKATTIKDIGLNAKQKTLVYATKFRSNEEAIWMELKKIAKKGNYNLVFKVAPANNLKEIKEKIKEEKNIRVVKSVDLFDLLNAADILVSIRSTVIMEALSMEKPVLLVDFYNTCAFPYEEMRAVHGVKKTENIEKGIKYALKNKETLVKNGKKFLKNYLNGPDGKATQRVVKIMKSLIMS